MLTGVGTEMTGYAPAEYGPFRCEYCRSYHGKSSCNHPMVVHDPAMRQRRNSYGVSVESGACCNYFRPQSK